MSNVNVEIVNDKVSQEAEEEEEQEQEQKQEEALDPVDGLRAWICVFGSFLMHFIVLGWIYSFSLFVSEYEQVFGVNRATVSVVYQLEIALLMGGGFISGRLADTIGVRPVMAIGAALHFLGLFLASFSKSWTVTVLTQGTLVGFGSSFLYWPAVTIIPMWFEKRRGLALGMAVLGSGIGNLVVGISIEKLLSQHGFRFTLRTFAFVSISMMSVSVICMKRRLATVRKGICEERSLLVQREFLLIIGSAIFFQTGYNVPFAHLAPYIQDLGLATDFAATAVGMVGIGSAIGRVILGFVADYIGAVRCFKGLMVATSVTCALWFVSTTEPSIQAFSFFFGFFSGGFIAIVPAVMAAYYGVQRLGSIMGFLAIALVPGSIIGPLVSGVLYDNTGSYDMAIIFTAVLTAVSSFILLFLRPPQPAAAPDGEISQEKGASADPEKASSFRSSSSSSSQNVSSL